MLVIVVHALFACLRTAVPVNEGADYINCWLELCQFQEFVGLVSLVDGPWAHDNGLNPEIFKKWRFSRKSNGAGLMPGGLLYGFEQLNPGTLEWCQCGVKQTQAKLKTLICQAGLDALLDLVHHGIVVHARQHA